MTMPITLPELLPPLAAGAVTVEIGLWVSPRSTNAWNIWVLAAGSRLLLFDTPPPYCASRCPSHRATAPPRHESLAAGREPAPALRGRVFVSCEQADDAGRGVGAEDELDGAVSGVGRLVAAGE